MTIITKPPKQKFLYPTIAVLAAIICIITVFAEAQQPVLKISNLGNNQFSVLITNGISTTNYTLYWTPALDDPNYLWQVLTYSTVGESNFIVDANGWSSGFFKVLIGTDFDGDGVPEWQDAQPANPAVGILSVTIDSPLSGAVFQ